MLEQEEAFESLEFIHVRFRYPESDVDILKDLSFKIESGKHYAFVGKNGAGKTTTMKMILGLMSMMQWFCFNSKSLFLYS